MEQFKVSHIRASTSVSSLVIVLVRYPFNCERCNSARWQNLFLLKPASFNSTSRWITIVPLSDIMYLLMCSMPIIYSIHFNNQL